VEHDGIEHGHGHQRQQVFQQGAQIASRLPVPDQVRELAAGKLHAAAPFRMARRHSGGEPLAAAVGGVGLMHPDYP
jgi:hypothetical protein